MPVDRDVGIPMTLRVRLLSAIEVAAFYTLALVTIWGGARIRPSIVPMALLLVGVCVASNVLHGDGRRRIGFSASEFWPCARAVAIVSVPLLVPLSYFAWKNRFWAPWNSVFAVAGYPVWSFAQEYAVLGFVTNRLEDALGEASPLIPWINGFLFSFAHLPNPVLMSVTFVSGVLFTAIFRRHRHLLPIAFAHAAFGLGISLALSTVNGVMSVGPGYHLRVGNPPGW